MESFFVSVMLLSAAGLSGLLAMALCVLGFMALRLRWRRSPESEGFYFIGAVALIASIGLAALSELLFLAAVK